MAPYALDWAHKEPIVASGGYDKNVLVWNIEHNLVKERNSLASGDVKEFKKVRRVGECVKLQGHVENVEGVVFNPGSSNELCSVSVDKQIILWDLRSGKRSHKLTNIHESDINCADWSELNTNHICTGSSDKTIAIIDIRKVLLCKDIE
jgi:WD40 repeat protein